MREDARWNEPVCERVERVVACKALMKQKSKKKRKKDRWQTLIVYYYWSQAGKVKQTVTGRFNNSIRPYWNPCQSLSQCRNVLFFFLENSLIRMLSSWTGERSISHDTRASLSDGMEVNPKLFVATNKLHPRWNHSREHRLHFDINSLWNLLTGFRLPL